MRTVFSHQSRTVHIVQRIRYRLRKAWLQYKTFPGFEVVATDVFASSFSTHHPIRATVLPSRLRVCQLHIYHILSSPMHLLHLKLPSILGIAAVLECDACALPWSFRSRPTHSHRVAHVQPKPLVHMFWYIHAGTRPDSVHKLHGFV